MGLEIFNLKDKVAMVTGSTRGLGEVAALALAKAGADIAVCGRSTADLERVTGNLRGLGRNARGFQIDVTDKAKVVALEWAKLGVRVNAIGPTYFETELVTQIRDDAQRFNFINERTPMGRWGHLPELEGTVIFLASAASDFITGQTIYVDGGWTAW